MTRVLAILLLALLVLVLLQRAWLAFARTPVGRGLLAVWRGAAGGAPHQHGTVASAGAASRRTDALTLLRCSACGVHVPEAEALPSGGSTEALCRRCRASRPAP